MLEGRIGDVTWRRIVEYEEPDFAVSMLLPDATDDALAPYRDWLEPRFLDPASQELVMANQSYLLRTRHHLVLVDSCCGNDKERRFHEPWAMRKSTAYMDGLAAAGVAVDDIDYVMCTHLHPDHVGWNTRLLDGRWVPTFPNAKYVFAKDEYAFWEKLSEKGKGPTDGSFFDSVLPVVEAGQAEMVAHDFSLDDEIALLPTPGHTPGHVSIEIASAGAGGIVTGDVMHTPLQVREPDWSAVGCSDRAQSAATRRALLERCVDTDTLVMTGHFPSPSVGHVVSASGGFDFRFLGE